MKSFRLTPVVALLCSMCVAQSATATISRFDGVYVFGDSLSDGGNAWKLTQTIPGLGFPPSNPIGPYAQRSTNGPTAGERLADLYGLTIAPSTSGGTNYAISGAATMALTVPFNPAPPSIPAPTPPGTIKTSNYIPFSYWYLDGQPPTNFNISGLANKGVQSQVTQFTSTAPSFDANRSLFMVWGGANDFFMFPALASTVPLADREATVKDAAANAAVQVASFVDQLYGVGARTFLVPNLPDLAKTPDSADLSADERAALTGLTQYFNGSLALVLAQKRALRSDITLIEFDTFAGFNDILADKAAYGLTDVTHSCLATPSCDPNSFLFWDEVHPTTKGHQIIAEQFYTRIEAAIPEPETYALIAAGLLLVSWQVRRRTVN